MNTRALQKAVQYLDSLLRFRHEREELPGLVVAIAHDGKTVFNKAYGYADLEKKEKLSPGHIFRVASHSKTFTATAIMQLAEQKKLHIEDCAVDYVPWLKQHKDKRWQRATLRQLMSHSAGTIRDGLDCDYWSVAKPFPDRETFKREMLKTGLVYSSNVRLKYSNFGYSLLGLVVETASGLPYNKYVLKHIIKPLGLKRTGPEFTPAIKSMLVTGYTRRDMGRARIPIDSAINTDAMSSATGFYSTAGDLCRYASAHFWGSGLLLKQKSKKQMQQSLWRVPNSKENDKYGLGFEVNFVGGRRFVGHGGGFPGHSTKTLFNQKNKLVVVALTNAIDGGGRSINEQVIGVIDWFQRHYTAKPRRNLKVFEGRFASLWEVADIVSAGNKLVSVYPGSSPFYDLEELEYVDEKTLRIKKAHGHHSSGELIHYHFRDGRAIKIIKAGSTLLPEKVWFARQKRVKVVSLAGKKHVTDDKEGILRHE